MSTVDKMQAIHSVLDAGGYFFFLAPLTASVRQELAKVEIVAGAVLMAYAEMGIRYQVMQTKSEPESKIISQKTESYQVLKDQGLGLIIDGIGDYARGAIELASIYSGVGLLTFDYVLSPLSKKIYYYFRTDANPDSYMGQKAVNWVLERIITNQKARAA